MIASLPMYDRPETKGANNRLWEGIRSYLGYGPGELTRNADGLDHWLAPDLLLSQTCGMPYRLHLHGHVQLVGTPVWDTPGEVPGYYHSVFIAHRDSLITEMKHCKDRRFAYNMAISQSGWAAAETTALAHGFSFTDMLETGAHIQSAEAVAKKHADVAALDDVTWRLINRHDPDLVQNLRVFHQTEPTPALPYITALGHDAEALYTALEGAIKALDPSDRAALCLEGITKISAADYLAVPSPTFPKVTHC